MKLRQVETLLQFHPIKEISNVTFVNIRINRISGTSLPPLPLHWNLFVRKKLQLLVF